MLDHLRSWKWGVRKRRIKWGRRKRNSGGKSQNKYIHCLPHYSQFSYTLFSWIIRLFSSFSQIILRPNPTNITLFMLYLNTKIYSPTIKYNFTCWVCVLSFWTDGHNIQAFCFQYCLLLTVVASVSYLQIIIIINNISIIIVRRFNSLISDYCYVINFVIVDIYGLYSSRYAISTHVYTLS
jgi:hypothetical protein